MGVVSTFSRIKTDRIIAEIESEPAGILRFS
jgi:hypothetical protein